MAMRGALFFALAFLLLAIGCHAEASTQTTETVLSLVSGLHSALGEIRHGALDGREPVFVGDSAVQLRLLADAIDQSVAVGAAVASDSAYPISTTQAEVGSLEALTCTGDKGPIQGPRQPKFAGKRGLFAIAIGKRGMINIDKLVRTVGTESFSFIFFNYDNFNGYQDFDWAKNVTFVKVPRQIKYWYYKRFLHPEVVAGYDYIFTWDDDILVDKFDADAFVTTMDRFHVDIAQPAVLGARYGLLMPQPTPFGRWTSFAEIQVPVFSREVWKNCVYPMLQWDLADAVGMDLIWTQVCAARGYDRMAIIDPQTVIHKNLKTMGHIVDSTCANPQTIHAEVVTYLGLGRKWCPSCFFAKPDGIFFAQAPILAQHTQRAIAPVLQPLRIGDLPLRSLDAGEGKVLEDFSEANPNPGHESTPTSTSTELAIVPSTPTPSEESASESSPESLFVASDAPASVGPVSVMRKDGMNVVSSGFNVQALRRDENPVFLWDYMSASAGSGAKSSSSSTGSAAPSSSSAVTPVVQSSSSSAAAVVTPAASSSSATVTTPAASSSSAAAVVAAASSSSGSVAAASSSAHAASSSGQMATANVGTISMTTIREYLSSTGDIIFSGATHTSSITSLSALAALMLGVATLSTIVV